MVAIRKTQFCRSRVSNSMRFYITCSILVYINVYNIVKNKIHKNYIK
jgi:hypothetical protein